MSNTERYLVTGGAGFIGSNVVERLVRDGAAVRVLDDFSTGRRENLQGLEAKIELVEGSITNAEDCARAMEGVRYVIHLAALPSVARSVEDPTSSHEVNVAGTLRVLEAARRAGAKRVISASSSAIYGTRGALPRREEDPPEPLSPYAASKLATEYYCAVYHRLHGLETVCMRYFNVFGPRQDPKSQYAAVVPSFVSSLLQGKSPTIYGDGEQSRDFTFVENVVEANLRAAKAPRAAGAVLNVACGDRFSVNQLLNTMRQILGSPVEARYAAARPGDVRHSHASIDRARDLIGYQPAVSFQEGLKRTVDWFRNQPS